MAVFRFKLQAVLTQRELVEQQRKRELAEALRGRQAALDELRRMQELITVSKRRLGDGLVGKVDLDRVSAFARYSGEVTRRAQAMVQQLAVLEQRVVEARGRLVEASRARRALELLRDRQRDAWRRRENRRELAALDEVAVQRHAARDRPERAL